MLVDDGGFGNLIPDREYGVQRRHRLLEDHRDLIAANGPQLGSGEGEQIAAFEFDQAAGEHVARRFRHEPKNGEGRDGLAAARFADDPQRLAGIQLERDVVHRPRGSLAVLGDEVGLQIADAEEHGRSTGGGGRGGRHAGSWRGSSASRTPSATAFSDITTKEIASPGKRVDHGAV